MNKPKVYFVGSLYQGCYYVRCWLPLFHNNWMGSRIGFSKDIISVKLATKEIGEADIVVFHRADTVEHHKIGMQLRALGKKIVFDNDDTYNLSEFHPFFGIDEKGFKESKRRKNNIINNFIINSDLVTTTTEYLANEYRKISNNVAVLPNYVDTDDWDEPKRNKGKKIRIGLVGSVAYHHDFYLIKDIISKLDKRDDIQLVLFGLSGVAKRKRNRLVGEVLKKEYAFWDTIKNKEHVPWCDMTQYFDTLNDLRLDMMLIPRRENHFNKCKSNIKFLEAAMVEIPVIASSFSDNNSPYDNDLNGKNGILVKDDKKSWENAISDLIEHKEKRLAIGKEAKKYVINKYNILDHYKEWEEVYRRLLK